MTDVKTLRLASVQLTAPLLAQFLTYQRVLLAELARHTAERDWAGRFAFAHAKALAESALDTLTQQKLRALISDFCGRRSAALTVKQRVAELTHQLMSHADAKAELVLQRAKTDLPKLEDLGELEKRYGAEALSLLRSSELELVTLHRDLAHVEGGGHLHQVGASS